MILALLTNPEEQPGETQALEAMAQAGLQVVHLRKPGWSRQALQGLLESWGESLQSRVILHHHHELAEDFPLLGLHFGQAAWWEHGTKGESLKAQRPELVLSRALHSLEEVNTCPGWLDRALLSPIYPSFSKPGYQASWPDEQLRQALEKSPIQVLALGGCNASKLKQIQDWGFAGAAFLGAVWQAPDPVVAWGEIHQAHQTLQGMT